jgi:heterodisulfide reductase subunit C
MAEHCTRDSGESGALRDAILSLCAVDIGKCYQCGKCTAGCPAAFAMDLPPHQVMRLGQLDRRDRVMDSRSIWLCASCQTCTSRCPQQVDICRVMDTLRQLAYREGRTKQQKDVVAFHESFLKTVELTGRLFEGGLLALYKLRTGHLLQDIALAPKMLPKLKKMPSRIRGLKQIGRAFERSRGDL